MSAFKYSLLILLFNPLITFGFERHEKIITTVLEIFSEEQFFTDRGIEDGIRKGTHARLFSEDGFVARALAISVDMRTTVWAIYHVRERDKLVNGKKLVLRRIKPELIPDDLLGLLKTKINHPEFNVEKYAKYYGPVIDKESGTVNGYKPFQPGNEKKDNKKYLIAKRNKETDDPFEMLEKRIDASDLFSLSMEGDHWDLKLAASPMTYSSLNNDRNYNLGTSIYNLDNRKYRVGAEYQFAQFSRTDNLTLESVSSTRHNLDFNLEKKKMWGDVSYFTFINYHREHWGDIKVYEHKINFAPIGLKVPILESKKVIDFSFFYAPTFEYFEADEPMSSDPNVLNTQPGRFFSENFKNKEYFRFRHGLGINYQVHLGNIVIKNKINFSPRHNSGGSIIDVKDNDMKNLFSLGYKLNPYFSVSYENIFTHDVRRKRTYFLPTTDFSHLVNFGLSLTF